MLAKSKRLNLKKDFKWVASGKKIDTKYAKLFIKIGDNTNPRVGIAISAQSFKKATERNRAKRLILAGFESLYSSLPSAINIMVLPKHNIVKVKSADVFLDLETVLRNEKITH